MNLLRLIRLCYSPKLIKEGFLAIQMYLVVIMAVMALVPLSNVWGLNDQLKVVYGGNTERLFYYTDVSTVVGYAEVGELVPVSRVLSEQERERIYQSALVYGQINDSQFPENDSMVNILVYSDELFEDAVFRLNGGEKPELKDKRRILVSEALAELYPVGSEIPLTLRGMDNSDTVRYEVAGVLDKRGVIAYIGQGGGTYDNVNTLGLDLQSWKNDFFIVTGVDEAVMGEPNWNYSAAFLVKEGVDVDSVVDQINREHSVQGRACSYREMYKETIHNLIMENMVTKLEMLILILLSVVLVFGFCGYLMINLQQKSRTFAVLYMCGLSRGKACVINALSVLCIIVPVMAVGLITAPYVELPFGKADYVSYNRYVCMGIAMNVMGSAISGVFVSFLRQRSVGLMRLYREV